MARWILFLMAVSVVLAAIVLFGLGVRARAAGEPREFGGYEIEVTHARQAVQYDLVKDGVVAYTLAGSTDLVCDPPRLYRLDDLLYIESCGGQGTLDASLRYTPLRARPDGWWARQVLGGGPRLIARATLLGLLGLIAVAITGAALGGCGASRSRLPRARAIRRRRRRQPATADPSPARCAACGSS